MPQGNGSLSNFFFFFFPFTSFYISLQKDNILEEFLFNFS